MNRTINLFLTLLALIPAMLPAAEPKPIQEVELDEHMVYTIPVSSARVTTISFPGPISAIDGAFVTIDGKTPGFFQIAHKPGSYFLSVRSLVKDATTNINVRWNNKTYVLELQDSKTPVLSLIFKVPSAPSKSQLERRIVTPAMLVGMLDKAKAYPVLNVSHPEAFEGVDYVSYADKPRVMDSNDFEIRLEEVFRFDPQDTLVFRVVLRNKTDREILYKPQGFSVRVGERLYSQSISDTSGVMPPKSDTPAYFAITGTPDGGRSDISVKNEFTVVLTKLDADTARAVDSVPLGGNIGGKGGFAK
ncbi:MAG TPA: hypothetical protein VHC44_03365 [Verrucomicrobiae bacterium]|nr:hypothetical protein [Verrucomicrobiae bacterium]